LLGSMRHSRQYDFQGHPRSGQGQEMTSVPHWDYFQNNLPHIEIGKRHDRDTVATEGKHEV